MLNFQNANNKLFFCKSYFVFGIFVIRIFLDIKKYQKQNDYTQELQTIYTCFMQKNGHIKSHANN